MEINNNNYYYILPEEISIDILSRLPAVSVIRCSSIRKSWRNLIVYNRNFAREFPRMHLLRGLESHHHHGASASYNDEYKVVRITYCRNRGYYVVYGRVQVYTLGNGNGWRDKGETSYLLGGHRNNLPSILANGALHWLEENEGEIVAFDLADEEFLILPSPPCFIPYDDEDKYSIQIQVLGGQLCTAFHDDENLTVGVWFFKNENKERNGNYKDRNGRAEYQSWSWIKEFDIEWEGTGYFTPFILTENGDVLYYSWKSLFCYDLKTATSKVLLDMEKRLSDDFYCLEAIPHLNSFISLKALGEEDTKIIIDQSQGRTTA